MDRDAILTIAMVVAVMGVWWYGLFPFHSTRNSLWMAFSLSVASTAYLIAGMVGYSLSRHDRFVAHTAWSPSVLWWEVGLGLALVPVAFYFWRKGLQH
jgi:hypothetical protein